MPERTVDAWVAAAVCNAFPEARIWDPTQAIRGRNWDRAIRLLGTGKIFIFEDQATPVARKRKTPLNTHRIDIGRAQIDWYCDEIERDNGGTPSTTFSRIHLGRGARIPYPSRSRQPAGSPHPQALSPSGPTSSAAPPCATR